jgi:riboflavin kinase
VTASEVVVERRLASVYNFLPVVLISVTRQYRIFFSMTTSENGDSTVAASSATAYGEDDVLNHLPIRMKSKVVRGFGRGSKDLGIPTANLSRDEYESPSDFDVLPCGIYWGFARIGQEETYKAAISIGYNPTYGNSVKTIEPHLIAPATDRRRHASSCGETVLRDFYDEPIRVSVVGYLRPELPFEGLEKLVEAIKNDILNSEKLGDSAENVTIMEREWVKSDEPVLTS